MRVVVWPVIRGRGSPYWEKILIWRENGELLAGRRASAESLLLPRECHSLVACRNKSISNPINFGVVPTYVPPRSGTHRRQRRIALSTRLPPPIPAPRHTPAISRRTAEPPAPQRRLPPSQRDQRHLRSFARSGKKRAITADSGDVIAAVGLHHQLQELSLAICSKIARGAPWPMALARIDGAGTVISAPKVERPGARQGHLERRLWRGCRDAMQVSRSSAHQLRGRLAGARCRTPVTDEERIVMAVGAAGLHWRRWRSVTLQQQAHRSGRGRNLLVTGCGWRGAAACGALPARSAAATKVVASTRAQMTELVPVTSVRRK